MLSQYEANKRKNQTVETVFIFQIRRRREPSPATSSSITFCRNNYFWFSAWDALVIGCGRFTSSSAKKWQVQQLL
jgi:hypothetical protein